MYSMEKVSKFGLMGASIMETGWTGSKKGMARKHGQILIQSILACGKKGRRMGMGHRTG